MRLRTAALHVGRHTEVRYSHFFSNINFFLYLRSNRDFVLIQFQAVKLTNMVRTARNV